MKRSLFIFLAAIIVACGCERLTDTQDIIAFDSKVPYYEILCTPEAPVIGKEGGEVEIIVSTPQTTRFSSVRNKLLNERFDSGGNVDVPFIKSFVRKQIDDYSARYIFTFERNDTGESKNIASRIVDSTYGHWSNDSGFIGYGQGILRITQK